MESWNWLENVNVDASLKHISNLLIAFSLIMLPLAITTSSFLTSNSCVLWWGPMFTFFSALLTLFSPKKLLKWIPYVFCVCTFNLTMSRTIMCGAYYIGGIDNLDGCYAPSTHQSWGSESGALKARNCSMDLEDDYSYSNATCVCYGRYNFCQEYALASGSNCEAIFSVYRYELAASCGVLSILTVLMMALIALMVKKTIYLPISDQEGENYMLMDDNEGEPKVLVVLNS